MKKFLLLTLLIWGIAFGLAFFWKVHVEAYGQSQLQFDVEREVYVVKTEDFESDVNHLRNQDEMYAGMPVTFFKTSGCEASVYAGYVSKECLVEKAQSDSRKGAYIGAGLIWVLCTVGFILQKKGGV